MDGKRAVSEEGRMMGWFIIGALGAITLLLLIWLGKLPRRAWEAVAAAIVLALAGYALQGSPGVAGSPAKPPAGKNNAAAALILIRSEMDRAFSPARPYLIPSDAWARDGDYRLAISYLKSGIRKNPKDADLWAGLGLQLMLVGDGAMSPPAQYAFDQARKYNPRQPAPDYFAGLTALFDGRPDETVRLWQRLLDNAPKEARWKERLESQVGALRQNIQQASAPQ